MERDSKVEEQMSYDYKAQQEKNQSHVDNPQVGDLWHEMFSPYHIVLAVTDTDVIICEKTKPTDDYHYTFDLSEIKTVTLEEHKNIVTYSSMRDKFVADVVPKCKMMPLIEEWRAKRKEAMLQEMKYFL
jgi:hypothetical protein